MLRYASFLVKAILKANADSGDGVVLQSHCTKCGHLDGWRIEAILLSIYHIINDQPANHLSVVNVIPFFDNVI
jgi:hypothetical protein